VYPCLVLLQCGLPSFYVVPYYLDKMKEQDVFDEPELFLHEVSTQAQQQRACAEPQL
jgi:hypothetical protein